MEVGYPPMEYLDEDGVTPIGFDVDMAENCRKARFRASNP